MDSDMPDVEKSAEDKMEEEVMNTGSGEREGNHDGPADYRASSPTTYSSDSQEMQIHLDADGTPSGSQESTPFSPLARQLTSEQEEALQRLMSMPSYSSSEDEGASSSTPKAPASKARTGRGRKASAGPAPSSSSSSRDSSMASSSRSSSSDSFRDIELDNKTSKGKAKATAASKAKTPRTPAPAVVPQSARLQAKMLQAQNGVLTATPAPEVKAEAPKKKGGRAAKKVKQDENPFDITISGTPTKSKKSSSAAASSSGNEISDYIAQIRSTKKSMTSYDNLVLKQGFDESGAPISSSENGAAAGSVESAILLGEEIDEDSKSLAQSTIGLKESRLQAIKQDFFARNRTSRMVSLFAPPPADQLLNPAIISTLLTAVPNPSAGFQADILHKVHLLSKKQSPNPNAKALVLQQLFEGSIHPLLASSARATYLTKLHSLLAAAVPLSSVLPVPLSASQSTPEPAAAASSSSSAPANELPSLESDEMVDSPCATAAATLVSQWSPPEDQLTALLRFFGIFMDIPIEAEASSSSSSSASSSSSSAEESIGFIHRHITPCTMVAPPATVADFPAKYAVTYHHPPPLNPQLIELLRSFFSSLGLILSFASPTTYSPTFLYKLLSAILLLPLDIQISYSDFAQETDPIIVAICKLLNHLPPLSAAGAASSSSSSSSASSSIPHINPHLRIQDFALRFTNLFVTPSDAVVPIAGEDIAEDIFRALHRFEEGEGVIPAAREHHEEEEMPASSSSAEAEGKKEEEKVEEENIVPHPEESMDVMGDASAEAEIDGKQIVAEVESVVAGFASASAAASSSSSSSSSVAPSSSSMQVDRTSFLDSFPSTSSLLLPVDELSLVVRCNAFLPSNKLLTRSLRSAIAVQTLVRCTRSEGHETLSSVEIPSHIMSSVIANERRFAEGHEAFADAAGEVALRFREVLHYRRMQRMLMLVREAFFLRPRESSVNQQFTDVLLPSLSAAVPGMTVKDDMNAARKMLVTIQSMASVKRQHNHGSSEM